MEQEGSCRTGVDRPGAARMDGRRGSAAVVAAVVFRGVVVRIALDARPPTAPAGPQARRVASPQARRAAEVGDLLAQAVHLMQHDGRLVGQVLDPQPLGEPAERPEEAMA